MYTLQNYGSMIGDSVRTDAYASALRGAIRPGAVVVDLGTGPGICALLACQFGARRVYAIEPADVINLAREIASANHYEERITFIQDHSTRVELPERADVIVSDIRGALPFHEHMVPSIVDARQRFLTPGGILIPQRDTMWAAIVEVPEEYQRVYVTPWEGSRYGLDMRAARQKVVNMSLGVRLAPEELLTEPLCWATLDYTCIENPDVQGTATWTVARAGIAHGVCVWFDTTLIEGIGFSNAPGQPELVYGSTFFPWAEPVEVAAGDRVTVALQANLVGKAYHWKWETCVRERGETASVKARFEQAKFFATGLSPAKLRRCADSHVPRLSVDGQIDRFILAQMTGSMSLGTIACRLAEEFPDRFASVQTALIRVSKLSQWYDNR